MYLWSGSGYEMILTIPIYKLSFLKIVHFILFHFISNLFHICGQKAKLQEILQFIKHIKLHQNDYI